MGNIECDTHRLSGGGTITSFSSTPSGHPVPCSAHGLEEATVSTAFRRRSSYQFNGCHNHWLGRHGFICVASGRWLCRASEIFALACVLLLDTEWKYFCFDRDCLHTENPMRRAHFSRHYPRVLEKPLSRDVAQLYAFLLRTTQEQVLLALVQNRRWREMLRHPNFRCLLGAILA